MKDLSERNTEAFQSAIKDLYERLYDQAQKIDAQNAAIATLSRQITDLDLALRMQIAANMGHGPTVK